MLEDAQTGRQGNLVIAEEAERCACRLCGSPQCREILRDRIRPYVRCDCCGLTFVPEEHHISPQQEILRYSRHTNHKTDKEYVAYLSSIAADVLLLPVASPRVLDFGSGPEHVLADILNGAGASCAAHDPLYGLNAAGQKGSFDIIVACESIEHVRNLPREIGLISGLLAPAGFVYVHTQLCDHVADFAAWWYIIDVTHINFFCGKTMGKVAQMMGKRIVRTNGKDNVIFG
jgi:Methyltransferase domain